MLNKDIGVKYTKPVHSYLSIIDIPDVHAIIIQYEELIVSTTWSKS